MSIYLFSAKTPQPAVVASFKDGQAAAVRAPVHRPGLSLVDVGKDGTKR